VTADDLEPLEPDGLHTLTLDQRARLAADGLRRATVMQPPSLGGRKLGLEGWARVAGLVVVVVLVAIGVTVLASDNRFDFACRVRLGWLPLRRFRRLAATALRPLRPPMPAGDGA